MHPSAPSSVPSVSSVVDHSASASSASSVVPPPSSSSPFASFALASRPSRSPSPSDSQDDPAPDPRTLTRREEAFTLYCQGYRSPAIAGLLGVPERTVRSWIAATLQASAEDARTRRDHQLRLAIESQRAIVKAAWHAYDRAARAERLTLEHLQNAVPRNVDDDDPPALDCYDPPSPGSVGARHASPGQGVRLPHLPTVGARYLQIVLHAQREIARLSGLYHLPDSFYDPDAGRPMQIVIRREPHLPRKQLAAWVAFCDQWNAAHSDDPVPSDDLVFPPDDAPPHQYAADLAELDALDAADELGSEPNTYADSSDDNCAPASDAGDDHCAAPSERASEAGDDPQSDSDPPEHIESAAETAIPHGTPTSPDLNAVPAASASPQGPTGGTGETPATIHPSLLPRLRRHPPIPTPLHLFPRDRGTP